MIPNMHVTIFVFFWLFKTKSHNKNRLLEGCDLVHNSIKLKVKEKSCIRN